MLIVNLSSVYERQLELAYDCEKSLEKELPKLAEVATSAELKNAFMQHLKETERHGERLEQIFASLDRAAATESNHVISSISGEVDRLVKHIEPSSLLDASLILNANQVEHYEMALYGALAALADSLGRSQDASILRETLEEEKQADRKLTELAEKSVNKQAVDTVNHPHDFVIV